MQASLALAGNFDSIWRFPVHSSSHNVIRRDKKSATKFCQKLLKGFRYVPQAIITDKLKSLALKHLQIFFAHVKVLNGTYSVRRSTVRAVSMDLATEFGELVKFTISKGLSRSHAH
jgi:transposase-like protein